MKYKLHLATVQWYRLSSVISVKNTVPVPTVLVEGSEIYLTHAMF